MKEHPRAKEYASRLTMLFKSEPALKIWWESVSRLRTDYRENLLAIIDSPGALTAEQFLAESQRCQGRLEGITATLNDFNDLMEMLRSGNVPEWVGGQDGHERQDDREGQGSLDEEAGGRRADRPEGVATS